MPMPPWRDFSWFFKALDGLYFVVAGLSSGLVVIIPISILGIWAFLKQNQWQLAVLIIVTVGLNMLASGFQKFPFHGRLILTFYPCYSFYWARA
jgi:type IV secretory pathway VirB2 component (pilin)